MDGRIARSLLLALMCAAVALPAAPALASDPPGNNGTVKIAGRDLDTIPDNEPHQGCTFTVQFYGYDEGPLLARAIFEVLRASGDVVVHEDSNVKIGEDGASGAGTATGLDASRTYDLNAKLAPYAADGNANQGVHVRLTVRAEGSIGADVKSKTFWAQGCQDSTPPS
jgi:hypothetical protein